MQRSGLVSPPARRRTANQLPLRYTPPTYSDSASQDFAPLLHTYQTKQRTCHIYTHLQCGVAARNDLRRMLTQRHSFHLKCARRIVGPVTSTCQRRSVRTLAVQVDGHTASTNSVDVSALASTDPALSSVQLSTASAGSVDAEPTRTPWFEKPCGNYNCCILRYRH